MLLYGNRNSKKRKGGRINERINELRELLPNCSNARYQQNKGSVLKATIEYIRELQTEYERFEKLEEKIRDTTVVYRGMLSRVQRLEAITTMQSSTHDFADSSDNVDIVNEPNTQDDINTCSQNN